MKVAAAYIRVSTEDQTELSPDSQLSVIRDYARKNEYIIAEEHIYIDAGISGRHVKNRPAFNQMIAAAKAKDHPFDTILIWKFSRFARNQEESIVYKAALRRDGVEVVSVSEPLIEGPFGALIERNLEWMDEYYSIRLSGEVRRSMTLNAQRGRWQGRPPYGYRIGEVSGRQQLVPHPDEAPIVKEIYNRYLAGEGFLTIAKSLNDAGVRTRNGNPFELRNVEYILTNPAYIGKLRWTPGGCKSGYFDNPNAIITGAGHDPLVDMALWDAVQEKEQARRAAHTYRAKPSSGVKDWLSGVVRCSACNATLTIVNLGRYHYFRCHNYGHGKCRTSQNIGAEKLHKAFLNRLEADSEETSAPEYDVVIMNGHGDELKRLEAAEARLDRKLERIRESYVAGIDSMEDYKKYRQSIEKERAAITVRKAEIAEEADPKEQVAAIRKQIKQTLQVLKTSNSIEVRNVMVKQLVCRCVFDKARMSLSVVYRFSL